MDPAVPEKLTGLQLVKKFPAFYGTPKVEVFALLGCYAKYIISYRRFGTTYRSRSAFTTSVAQPVCYSVAKTGRFPRNKVAGTKLTSHLLLMLKLKMRGVILPHH